MGYTIVTQIGSGAAIRSSLPTDAGLDEAKELGIRELKKLLSDGVFVSAATIEADGGAIVSSIRTKDHLTYEYLGFLEDNYLAAWT